MDKRRAQILFIPVLMILTVLFGGIKAFADPAIARIFARSGQDVVWYVNGIEGDLIQEEGSPVKAAVSAIPCDVACSDVTEVEGVHFDTIILLDNSLSISEPNREKAKELIRQLIQNHAKDEVFELYTFEKTLNPVASGSDYAALSSAVDGIEFQNQDAYLIDCMASLLQEVSQRDSYDYLRIILISDGVDDNKLGYTYDELLEMIGDDQYRCPVYTVASIWEKDTSGLKNLQSLSRKAGSETFVLDEVEDVHQIVETLTSDYRAKCFLFRVPLEQKDGMEKNIDLSFRTSMGSYELNHVVKVPSMTEEEKAEYERLLAEMEQTEAVSESETETKETEKVTEPAAVPILVSVEETETEQAKPKEDQKAEKKNSFFDFIGSNVYMVIAGGVILLAVIIIVILLVRRKKKKSVWDDDQYFGSMAGNQSAQQGGMEERPESALTVDESEPMTQVEGFTDSFHEGDSRTETVGMWSDASTSNSRRLILTDISDSRRRFEAQIRDEIIIGRDSLCTIVLSDDRTVSSNHCKISNIDGTITVQDLNSRNGTYVNSEQLLNGKGVILRSGDELKMGRSRMLVEIR